MSESVQIVAFVAVVLLGLYGLNRVTAGRLAQTVDRKIDDEPAAHHLHRVIRHLYETDKDIIHAQAVAAERLAEAKAYLASRQPVAERTNGKVQSISKGRK